MSSDEPGRGLSGLLSANGTIIAFALFVLGAGGNPVAIRLSMVELPPFFGGAARLAAAAAVFWLIVAARRIPLPRGRALAGALLYGLVGLGVALAIAYWALVRIQPGMASVFLGLVPLATVLLASAHGLETLTWRKVAGAVVAVAGIGLIARGGITAGVALASLLGLMVMPLAMAEGSLLVKIFRPGNPFATNALAFSVGAAVLAALSALAGETWRLPATAPAWAALGYLVVVGSVLVFYTWLIVLSRWPASRTSYGFVLMPVVTVTASALLTGEAITASLLVGAALALAGVWLGAISTAPRVAPPPVEAAQNACLPTC